MADYYKTLRDQVKKTRKMTDEVRYAAVIPTLVICETLEEGI
jgi:hypothetical protein